VERRRVGLVEAEPLGMLSRQEQAAITLESDARTRKRWSWARTRVYKARTLVTLKHAAPLADVNYMVSYMVVEIMVFEIDTKIMVLEIDIKIMMISTTIMVIPTIGPVEPSPRPPGGARAGDRLGEGSS
jgi:hypothetical protein